jgi:hypothetical protein
MPDFELRLTRRARGARRRGLSGLGLLLVGLGLLVLAIAYSGLPSWIAHLWPLALAGVGVFGLLRPPGWVEELDVAPLVSYLLIGAGCLCLLFTTGLLDARLIGPGALVALGGLLIWRRVR